MNISVIIPLYNKEMEIKRCLDSIFRQKKAPFEIIVIDDGSTDSSWEVVENYSEPRVRLFGKANGGVSTARNYGIEKAKGEIIAFLDADDEWEPEFIATIRRLAGKFPQAAVYSTGYRRIYPHLSMEIAAKGDGSREFLIDNYFSLARVHSFVTSSNTAVRKDAFLRAGFFAEGEKYSEDQDMWARLALHFPIAYSRGLQASYYCHKGGPTPEKHTLEPPVVVQTLKRFIRDETVPREKKRDLVRLANKKVYERFEGVARLYPGRVSRKFLQEHLVPATPGYRLLLVAAAFLPNRFFYHFGRLWRSRHLRLLHRVLCREKFEIVYRSPDAG